MSKNIILFDINETVLDLGSLKEAFTQTFGREDAVSVWFAKLLHSSTVCITTGVKSDFATLAGAMLDNIAALYKVELPSDKRQELLGLFASLPAHSDIKPALKALSDAGFKTVAFSNSSSELILKQLTNAGLIDDFDTFISVEETGSFKPDLNVYQFAAQKLGQDPANLRLVATHDWDTHGALSAGLQAAYIARTPAPYHPLYKKPDIQANTMLEIAEQIIAKG